jgi:hypothetical protein
MYARMQPSCRLCSKTKRLARERTLFHILDKECANLKCVVQRQKRTLESCNHRPAISTYSRESSASTYQARVLKSTGKSRASKLAKDHLTTSMRTNFHQGRGAGALRTFNRAVATKFHSLASAKEDCQTNPAVRESSRGGQLSLTTCDTKNK